MFRKHKLLAVVTLLLTTTIIGGQEAKVIQLSQEDTAIAHAKWQALQDAQKTWDEEQKRLAKKYTFVHGDDPEAGDTQAWDMSGNGLAYSITSTATWTTSSSPSPAEIAAAQKAYEEHKKKDWWFRSGWESGFDFSKDFRFIVPKAAPRVVSPNCWNFNTGSVN